jgi:phosphoglycolate phosphatase-like HAD superfamily hydrolase
MRVIFDVDGTLIESVAIDAELYDQAFLDTFGVRLPTTDWTKYENATDGGIAGEAIAQLSLPSEALPELRRRFVELLGTVESIAPLPGARQVIQELATRGIAVGIATGGWRDAAIAKLRAAAVAIEGVPLVGSDASPRRCDIVSAAIERVGGEGDVFYVGDGPWDMATSRALGIGFVGVDTVGHGRFAERAVRDFADVDYFVGLLMPR